MRIIKLVIVVLVLFNSCKSNTEQMVSAHPIIEYLDQNRVEPNTYLINKFEDHQVIFLGENHWIKQQVDFVVEVIPELYANGIYNLGTEFLNYEDTETANQLITADTFDELLAQKLAFKSDWAWGYKEYIDIYKKAWELNKNLPSDAKKFRIFGIQEVMDFSYVNKVEDFQNPDIMAKVFAGSYEFDEDEGYSAQAIQTEVLDKGEKALIHCGIHHAFTSYYQPRFNAATKSFGGVYEKERMGNLIKNKIGNKTMTIFLHGSWGSDDDTQQVFPVEGVLDSLFTIDKNQYYMPFGVDTKIAPFGNLTGNNSKYKYGYPNFKLKDFCDGYIFFTPLANYDVVTQIPDFIKSEHVDYIKSQEFDYRDKDLKAKDLNDSIKAWLKDEQEKLRSIKF